MEEQKEKLFNFSLLRLVSANDFLGLLKTGLFVWLLLYGFSLAIFFGFDWLGDLVGDTLGITSDKWTDPVFNKSISFWIILVIFGWMFFSVGLKNILRNIGGFFHNLSKYSTIEIVISVFLFAIIPWLPFLFLPAWLAIAFPFGFMTLGALITMLDRSARKCPTAADIFSIVDLNAIISNDFYSDSIDKKKIINLVEQIYAQKTWEEQIQTLADTFVDLTEKKKPRFESPDKSK